MCVSPVVTSVDNSLAVSESCERRMPRVDGVRRDCWTAMVCLQLLFVILQGRQGTERVRFIVLIGWPGCARQTRLGGDRYSRQRKDESVFNQVDRSKCGIIRYQQRLRPLGQRVFLRFGADQA